ncbi:hypothetical protein DH2020_045234 [Rehmannia glutinosa]|uniref:Myb/SANT-like domain-containing protein n=1 Tax=Rehmannia glutinosa TaxID=99300 RepID=A0ABR0UFT4_REHGL
MMRTSGFRWNDEANMITVKDDVWHEYVKVDPYAKTMQFKPWPYFKDWNKCFGKDRATGENAQTFAEILKDVFGTDPQTDEHIDGQNYAPSEPVPRLDKTPDTHSTVEGGDVTLSYQADSCASGKSKGKKMKRAHDDDNTERFVDLLASFCAKTDARLGDIAYRIGFEQNAASARKAINEALQKIQFLSTQEKIAVGTKLCSKTKELDYLFSLNDEDKAMMVQMILEGCLD